MNGQQSGSNTGAMVAAGGGLLAVIGVFLPWFKSSVSYSGELFGGTVPAQTQSFAGMKDWTGIVALIAGLLVAGAAIGLITSKGGGNSKMMGTLVRVGGIIVVLAAILGYIRIGNTAGAATDQFDLAGSGIDVSSGAGLGLYLSAIGGLLGAIGGFMAKGKGGDGGGMGMTPPSAPAA